ncbi:NAD(P)H-dependent oxidoreductase [Saccharomonospora sp. NPDC006951]
MNVLWIYAHPEERSLSGSLKNEGIAALREAGHEVRLRDLYAMKWNPVVDAADFGQEPDRRLLVGEASKRAAAEGTLSADIRAEHEHIRWADTIVTQFPLWWLGPPAILKGWFDRVLLNGFAFGVKDENGHTLRYGDGGLAGKRAMVITTIGAREASFGPRGIHGELNDVLFPLQHGLFWYTGMAALPPLAIYGADRASEEDFAREAGRLRRRLLAMPGERPVPFRHQDGGDYDENLVLRSHIAPGQAGLGVHYA